MFKSCLFVSASLAGRLRGLLPGPVVLSRSAAGAGGRGCAMREIGQGRRVDRAGQLQRQQLYVDLRVPLIAHLPDCAARRLR